MGGATTATTVVCNFDAFNWTMMVETMGRTDTPKESIENLLHVRQIHFPEQPIDWEYLLDEFAQPSSFHRSLLQERCVFSSCAACRIAGKPFPSKFGVIISDI